MEKIETLISSMRNEGFECALKVELVKQENGELWIARIVDKSGSDIHHITGMFLLNYVAPTMKEAIEGLNEVTE